MARDKYGSKACRKRTGFWSIAATWSCICSGPRCGVITTSNASGIIAESENHGPRHRQVTRPRGRSVRRICEAADGRRDGNGNERLEIAAAHGDKKCRGETFARGRSAEKLRRAARRTRQGFIEPRIGGADEEMAGTKSRATGVPDRRRRRRDGRGAQEGAFYAWLRTCDLAASSGARDVIGTNLPRAANQRRA